MKANYIKGLRAKKEAMEKIGEIVDEALEIHIGCVNTAPTALLLNPKDAYDLWSYNLEIRGEEPMSFEAFQKHVKNMRYANLEVFRTEDVKLGKAIVK